MWVPSYLLVTNNGAYTYFTPDISRHTSGEGYYVAPLLEVD
jgi:hypothetical protein